MNVDTVLCYYMTFARSIEGPEWVESHAQVTSSRFKHFHYIFTEMQIYGHSSITFIILSTKLKGYAFH